MDKIRIKSGLNQDKIWIKGHGRAFKEPSCTSECFVCETCENSEGSECPISACSKQEEKCNVDGYVGSYVMIENESQRIWNFTLEPGTHTACLGI